MTSAELRDQIADALAEVSTFERYHAVHERLMTTYSDAGPPLSVFAREMDLVRADAVLAVLQAARDERRTEFLNLKVSLVNAARRGDMDRISELEEKLNGCFDAAFGGAEEVTG